MDSLDIEEGAGQVSRALKIKDKRAEELKDLCCESVSHYSSVSECMDVMQTYAKDANELAYCNYRIGVCSRCPASMLKRELGEDEDIDGKLGDIWDNKDK